MSVDFKGQFTLRNKGLEQHKCDKSNWARERYYDS